ncbi:hypothetical protein [Myxosarcina sp. GI1]|uniref:hypothetical protein n=1 Tax=Myxosarcina sp. GI1 TaxID=1541065 RepID=UPI00056D3B22|nr:hypothetical protein [Myxosarcina sp. GI1]
MTIKVLATAKVHWRSPKQGGRTPPTSSVYAATARFDESDEMFSIVLKFLTANDKTQDSFIDEAEVGFLAPELVMNKLAPGKKLLIA